MSDAHEPLLDRFVSNFHWPTPGIFLAGFLKFSVKGSTFIRKTPSKAGFPSQHDTVVGDFINTMKRTFDFNFEKQKAC